jgi:hypothetical protein
MSEKNVEKLIKMLKEAAYIPGDWQGVSDRKIVDLDTALKYINLLRDERY